jgi:hypothetical protein
MRRPTALPVLLVTLIASLSCLAPPKPLPEGLLLSLAVLEDGPDGPIPQPARLGMLRYDGRAWQYEALEDPDSVVFHKAMVYRPRPTEVGILTAAGTRAILKLWQGSSATILWEKDFGGKFSRMRDVEAADLDGDGDIDLAVATHDQGVVAIVSPTDTGFAVNEIDSWPGYVVHEIEIGDLDGDSVLEVYATPSLPNKLDGTPQPGSVVKYVPALGQGRTLVGELGDRHAKEILVGDVDGDGRDELYASVEAVAGGRVEILRYDADTPADAGALIASLDDTMCRFLTAGDVDGDGRKEMVAAANKSGLWLLRPGSDPHAQWMLTSIDRDSSGFEHAALLTDLDRDGVDELYVANDKAGQVNRYRWIEGAPVRELLYTHPKGLKGFTWNIMPAPVELMPKRGKAAP